MLEQQLSQQLFTQDGRHYVKGNPNPRCNFAFLIDPRFAARESSLVIRATFTGRSSLDLFGKCVGFGDSFPFEVLAEVDTDIGVLRIRNPRVTLTGKTSFYARRVRGELEKSIASAIRYPIQEEVRKLLVAASQSGPYKVSIAKLAIRGLRVQANSLLVDVDTRFVVE
ncbi:MAG: hypothetical protein NW208_00235 [Bryobacter sp.]|nr:hypothetical protein [Bryobacter sp.]